MTTFLDLGPGSTLLVVVAHPDDEAFGCGSALLLAAESGVRTVVACATRGEAGEPAVPLGEADLGDLRERELRSACSELGVTRVDVWGFADSGMAGPPPAGSLAATPPDHLAQAVRRAVAGVAPDAVLTLDASDGHRDHAAVRRATEEVGREHDLPTWLTCLPRSLMTRWAEHQAGTGGGEAYRALAALGTPDEDLTHVLDATAVLPRRERAMAAHGSQASPYAGLPTDLRDAFLGAVHLRLVPPRS
jgi:N-acetyl-1-D-myo-inositol-2-amino-2-deoxy-alpha-D-glucopyranoside deacetylase